MIPSFNNRDTRMILVFLNIFSTTGIANILLITLIPTFGTTLIKTLLKIFTILYSFLISRSFSLRVTCTFDLTLFERSGFTLSQHFLLTLRFWCLYC